MNKINRNMNTCGAAMVLASTLLLPLPAIGAGEAQAHMQKAGDFAKAGDYKSAVIELKNALQAEPSNAQARRMLGQTYMQTGDMKSAEKELRRAVALGADSPELRIDLAEALLRQGRADEAVERLEPIPTEPPALHARALTLLGFVAMSNKDLKLAREEFGRALVLQADNKKAHEGLLQLDVIQNDPQSALQRIETILAIEPANKEIMLLKGELLRKQGEPQNALQVFNQILSVDDKHIPALIARVTVNLSLGNVDAAKADLDRVDQIKPDVPMARYFRSVIDFQEGRHAKAREHVQAVLSVMPDHAPSQLLYGLIGFGLGEYEVAEEFLGRFKPGTPFYPVAARTLGATRIRSGEPDRAVEILEPLYDQQPDDVKLMLLLGNAYLQLGEHEKSAELMQKAVDKEPDAARYRAQLAVGLLGSGKTDLAVEQLQSAVELDADLVQADVLLVATHMRKGEYEKALKASQAFEARRPNDPVAYNLTGLVLLSQKHFDEATAKFEKALAIDPDFVVAETNLARIDMARKDFGAAEKRYDRTLKVQPDNVNALLGMAGIAEVNGDDAMKEKWLETAIERLPNNPRPAVFLAAHYLKSNEPLKALNIANNAVAQMPDNPATLEILARSQNAAGQKNSAVRTLEKLSEIAPTEENFRLLAAGQLEIGDSRGARNSLEAALTKNPNSPNAKLSLAVLAHKEGKYEEALKLVQQLQQDFPDHEEAYRLEGVLRLKQEQQDLAMAAFKKAYSLKPTAESARQMANLYEQRGQREQAIAAMLDWTQANPDDLPMRMVLAVSYQKWGQDEKAVREYEAIAQKAPDNAVVLNNLSWLYFQANDSRAIETAKKAYDINPERAEIADTYGWILLKQGGQPQKALSILQEAYVTAPTNSEIGYHVAVALHEAGRNDEAERTLRQLLAERADFPQRGEVEKLYQKLTR